MQSTVSFTVSTHPKIMALGVFVTAFCWIAGYETFDLFINKGLVGILWWATSIFLFPIALTFASRELKVTPRGYELVKAFGFYRRTYLADQLLHAQYVDEPSNWLKRRNGPLLKLRFSDGKTASFSLLNDRNFFELKKSLENGNLLPYA